MISEVLDDERILDKLNKSLYKHYWAPCKLNSNNNNKSMLKNKIQQNTKYRYMN